jgi:hypothetical protein
MKVYRYTLFIRGCVDIHSYGGCTDTPCLLEGVSIYILMVGVPIHLVYDKVYRHTLLE